MQPALQIDLFGDFRILSSDELLAVIPQARQQALLVYLLLHRSAPQPRAHVAFLLWPDSSEAQALSNLRKMLTHLRQTVPVLAQALYADHKVIQWRPTLPFTLDVADFEVQLAQANAAEQAGCQRETLACLAAAVDLYAGPLVPSCYGDWILAERERCQQLCLNALERLITLYERQGNLTTAIHYAQQLLRLDPLQETIYLQLMRLQALHGDRSGALRTYHTCATILERELDVAPGEETQAAYARLLKQEPSATGQAMVARRPHFVSTSRLIGRQVEWTQLQSAWRLATQHRAHFVCILGEAGIGKTHLAEEMLVWASQQGFAVARTRSYAGEGQLAYAPVVEWLRSEPIRAVRQRVAKTWLSEVARLAPEVLTEQPDIPTPTPMTERWQRQQLWEALARTLLAAPQPLLLLIDDLQWCDQETLEWLRYLLHFDTRSCLLVMGTARPEEIDDDHPLSTLLRHLRSAEQLTELELGSLDAEQTATLAARITLQPLTPEMQQALYRATAGNPLFVVETVRAGLSEGAEAPEKILLSFRSSLPPKVQAVIQSRLAQLSPSARDLARLAAVICRAFSFELLVQASGGDEDALARALDELWQRRIIREQDGAAYDFSHDRIRDVAYAAISPAQRGLFHRRVAQALETIHIDDLDRVCVQLAVHYELAGATEQAIKYYQQAAIASRSLHAYTDMITYLHKLLHLLDTLPETRKQIEHKLDTLLLLGSMLRIVKGFAALEVEEIYNQAWELCQRVTDVKKRYQTLYGLSLYWCQRCCWQMSAPLSREMLQLAQQIQNPIYLQDALQRTGSELFHQGKLREAQWYFEQVDTLYSSQQQTSQPFELSIVPEFTNFCLLAANLWLLGYAEQAQAKMVEALARAHIRNEPFALLFTLDYAFELKSSLYDQQAVSVLLAEMTNLLTKHPFPYYVAESMICHGWLLTQQGKIAEGISLLKQGTDVRYEMGAWVYLPYSLSLLAEAYGRAKQFRQGLTVLTETLMFVSKTNEQYWNAELYRLQGELLLEIADGLDQSEASFRQAIHIARQQSAKALELRAIMSLARLWQRQGKYTEAHRMLSEIYDWFTEGFDTADLQTAKMLLAELQAMR